MKPFKTAESGDRQTPKPSTQTDGTRADAFKQSHAGAGDLPDVALEDAAPIVGDSLPWPAAEPEKDNAGHRPFRVKE